MWLRRIGRSAPLLAVITIVLFPLLLWYGPGLLGRIRYFWSERTASHVEIPGLTLEASADESPDGDLVIHFTVRNDTPGEVALFVGTFEHAPESTAYLDVEGDLLHVRKQHLREPPGTHGDYWYFPYVAILQAGQEYKEDIRLRDKVKVNNPALRREIQRGIQLRAVQSTSPVRVAGAMLHVGAYRIEGKMSYKKATFGDPPPGFFQPVWTHRQEDIAILETVVALPRALTVLDYE